MKESSPKAWLIPVIGPGAVMWVCPGHLSSPEAIGPYRMLKRPGAIEAGGLKHVTWEPGRWCQVAILSLRPARETAKSLCKSFEMTAYLQLEIWLKCVNSLKVYLSWAELR